MNAFAIMELIGLAAAVVAFACFLLGERGRLGVFQQAL